METSTAAYNNMHPLVSHAVWAAGTPFGRCFDGIAPNPDQRHAFRAPASTRRRAGDMLTVLWSNCVPSFAPFGVETVEMSTCKVTLQKWENWAQNSRKILGFRLRRICQVRGVPVRSSCPHSAASRPRPGGREQNSPQSCPGWSAAVSHPLRAAFQVVAGSAHSRP